MSSIPTAVDNVTSVNAAHLNSIKDAVEDLEDGTVKAGSLNIGGLTAQTSVDQAADYGVILDSSGNVIRKTLIRYLHPSTTKGDLTVGGASGLPTRVPVGTNGHALLADSGEATGVRWGAAATDPATLAHCVLTLNADEPIPSGTGETLAWDAANPNVGGMWVSGTDVTIATAGYYAIGFIVVTDTVNQVGAWIQKNGSTISQALSYENNSFGNSQAFAPWEGLLSVADVITFVAYASAGGSPNARDTEEGGTRAWVRRIY